MKKSFLVPLVLLALWQTLSSTLRDPSNPPTARTGAPGEQTCANTSDCHNGGSFTGTVSISGVPDTVAPNTSYAITLKNESNCTRAGFQLTCLTGANAKCGTLTAGTGNNISNNNVNGRQYVRQSSAKNLSGGSASWNFTWKSPASIVGDSATFYFITLCANNNNQRTGDNVLRNTKKVVMRTASAASEPGAEAWLDFKFLQGKNALVVDLKNGSGGHLQVFDGAGRLASTKRLESSNVLDFSVLKAGVYSAVVESEGRKASRRFVKAQ